MKPVHCTNADELRQSFLNFMRKNGAVVVPGATLLPANDPTTLFTGSGMQPMVPYLLGERHPAGDHIVNVQKCVRTRDIDAVGDISHLTFFEMAGRWAFGADPQTYKDQQIHLIWEWQIGQLGIDPRRLYVTVFEGASEMGIALDSEAIDIWKKLFRSVGMDAPIEAEPYKYGMSRGGRILIYGQEDNWWSRAGACAEMPIGEPGGPDSEMFYDFDPSANPLGHPAIDKKRFVEIGNNVFMSYKRTEQGFEPLRRPNIDYGGGLERIAAAIDGKADVYLTSFFASPRRRLETLTGRPYADGIRSFRVILDHTRAATFLMSDGALPSNSDAGYITRRLIRRAIREGRKLGLTSAFLVELSEIYIGEASAYPELAQRKADILTAVSAEEQQFSKTLHAGEREMKRHLEQKGGISGAEAFYFYETFGFPRELTEEFLVEHGVQMADPEGFRAAAENHAEKSRTASAGKFKGGLADDSEKTTALHTATHLMLAGLRRVLGNHVHQRGSNITAERARFDFSHHEKLTAAQKKAVEDYVNNAIAADAEMAVCEVPTQKAKGDGVEGSFWETYPDVVKVYTFEGKDGQIWSREVCGGPHCPRTGELRQFGRFRIQKEESVAQGVRRIKAALSE
jgi:alanyl-tRNA synthetase